MYWLCRCFCFYGSAEFFARQSALFDAHISFLQYGRRGLLLSSKQRFHSVARFPTRSVPLIVGVHARNRSLQTLPARLFSQSRRIIHPACGEFWPGLASVSVSRLRGFCPARSAIFEGSVPQNQIPAFRHSRSMPEFQSRSSR